MNNKTYDILKTIALLVLPAGCTLIATIGGIWNIDVEKIVLTIAAVDTFLGAVLGVSSSQYRKQMNEEE